MENGNRHNLANIHKSSKFRQQHLQVALCILMFAILSQKESRDILVVLT